MTQRYHYTNCGLDYVYLDGGYTLRETSQGTGVSIKDARQLHEVIAREIITRPDPLRGQEVRFLRSMMQLSQEHLAQRVLRQKRGSVARWEAEPNKAIPGPADQALRMFYALKVCNHETACRLVEVLQELDELEHEESLRTGTLFGMSDEQWRMTGMHAH